LRVRIFTIATVLLSLALAAPANGAFPGQNGKIAYDRYDAETDETVICLINPGSGAECPFVQGVEPAWSPSGAKLAYTGGGIWTVNADGSGAATVTSAPDGDATWSSAGSRIAFARFANLCVPTCVGEIYVVDTDGTDEVNLTNDSANDQEPAWSPDGQLIAWQRDDSRIWTMKPDGTGKTDLASGINPNWSPDGTKLAFTRTGIWVMNADGSGQTQLTSGSDSQPAWSPDGEKIAFKRADSTAVTEGIWTVDADGSNVTPVVTESGFLAVIDNPDWQPLPDNTIFTPRYPRPKGANPMYLSLVPAYNPCTASNRTHGPPLAYGSCNPPAPESSNLTVGVGDGSPALSRSVGAVRLNVQGMPAPPEDSDVRIRFSLTNVMKASDLSEYTGELRGTLTVRRTDREGSIIATTQDFPLSFTVPCSPTPGSSLDASTCQLDTTVDALIPNTIKDSQRAIWALDKLRVYDGGPDGDADTEADNSLFATQGVFVP
jgi:Tol biopolymer transport system component